MTSITTQKASIRDSERWKIGLEYMIGDDTVLISTIEGTNTIHIDDIDWLIEELKRMNVLTKTKEDSVSNQREKACRVQEG